MGDDVFNISKGKVGELAQRVLDNDPATAVLAVHLWTGAISDADLIDLDFVASIEAAGDAAESIATAYVRKLVTDSGENLLVTVTDASDKLEVDFDDITWTAIGNGTNSVLTRLTVHFDGPGTDVDATVPNLCFFDFSVTTDGSDITAQLDATGFFRAT